MSRVSSRIALFCLLGSLSGVFGVDSGLYAQLQERHDWFKRQSPNTDCLSSCNSYSTEISACGVDMSCLCGSTMMNGLYECVQCSLQFNYSDSQIQQLESSLNLYASSCRQLGYPVTVPSLTPPSNPCQTTGAAPSIDLPLASPQPSQATPPPQEPTTAPGGLFDEFLTDSSLADQLSSLLGDV